MIRSQAHKQSEHTVFLRGWQAAYRHGAAVAAKDPAKAVDMDDAIEAADLLCYTGAMKSAFVAGHTNENR